MTSPISRRRRRFTDLGGGTAMLDQIGSTIGVAIQFLSSLMADREDRLNHRFYAESDRLIAALRTIYFTPNGIREILEVYASGGTPEIGDIERILPRFNDAEWLVRERLHLIEFERLHERREVSLAVAEQLDKIRYGKINIRRDLQEALNERITANNPIPADEARELLAKIDALNATIAAVEADRNFRANRG